MRFIVKFPLIATACMLATSAIIASPALAGSQGVNESSSGPSNTADTFSPGGSSTAVNQGFSNLLESIRSEQSVLSVNGDRVAVPTNSLETLVNALSYGRGNDNLGVAPIDNSAGSGDSPSTSDSTLPSGDRGLVNRPGGSVFSLRDAQLNQGSSSRANGVNRPGGNVFSLRNSQISGSSDSSSDDVSSGPGGNIFSLRTRNGERTASNDRSARIQYSPAARTAIDLLEQQIELETGFAVDIDIINNSVRNYDRAVSAANNVVRQLNSQQLNAAIESPTFVALLRLLGNVDLEPKDEADLAQMVDNVFGIPLMSLRES